MKNANMIQLSKIAVVFFLIGAFSGFSGCSNPETPQQSLRSSAIKFLKSRRVVTTGPFAWHHCFFASGCVFKKTSGGRRPERGHIPNKPAEESQKPLIADAGNCYLSPIILREKSIHSFRF